VAFGPVVALWGFLLGVGLLVAYVANRNWLRNLAVASILADTIADLKPQYPPVASDVPPKLVIE
jgi:hypothetical protein